METASAARYVPIVTSDRPIRFAAFSLRRLALWIFRAYDISYAMRAHSSLQIDAR